MKKIFIQDDNISRILDIKNQDCDSRIKLQKEKNQHQYWPFWLMISHIV